MRSCAGADGGQRCFADGDVLQRSAARPEWDGNLYVVDDIGGETGAIDGGWTLNITTVVAGSPTTMTVASSANPSLTTQAVTFTATVVKTSDSSAASGSVNPWTARPARRWPAT
jgi:hypothetical protein